MSTRNQNIITHLIQTISATFHTHPLRGLGGFLLPLWGLGGCLLLLSCSDWNDIGTETIPDGKNTVQEQTGGIAFSGNLITGQMATGTTRADGTIVNWKQNTLPESEQHDYYRVDENGDVIHERKTFYAGIFGAYTGEHTWANLVTLSYKLSPTEEEQETLNKYYSANHLYNVQANIGAAVNGANSLSYSPYRLWPNDRKYMTFWGYYPYNPTSSQGEYGIAIINDENGVGEGKGMGKVHFTMHPDASLQNDFLISAPATDCTRDEYPLQLNEDGTYSPKPVRLNFYHMLAQVRIYAYITGTDKLVYLEDEYYAAGDTYYDEYGVAHTVTAEEAGKIQKIDEENSLRWKRTDIVCMGGIRMRADIKYSLEFNNIKTEADFFPDYTNPSGATIGCTTATTLGYATINHYIMNPYWFTYKGIQRERLNDNYMFGLYEDTPAYNRLNATTSMTGYDDIDGVDWSNTSEWGTIDDEHRDPLGYMTGMDEDHKKLLKISDAPDAKHYNFAPGNTLLVVPQELSDDDVPHIILTAKGKRAVWDSGTSSWTEGEELTAKVTINMLKMSIKWESGIIYCYAFLDELKPGDDKVRGPESITVVFDTNQYTDQW